MISTQWLLSQFRETREGERGRERERGERIPWNVWERYNIVAVGLSDTGTVFTLQRWHSAIGAAVLPRLHS